MGKLGKAFCFLLAVMLLLTAVSRAAASFTVAQVLTEQPQARRIVHTVTGEGTVEKMGERPVFAVAGVLVAEIAVRQGQNVKTGDVLARLDMDSVQEKMDALASEIEALRLQNQELEARAQKEAQSQSREEARAREDYSGTLSQGKEQEKDAGKKVEDAGAYLEEAKEDAYERIEKELSRAAEEAEDAYALAVEEAESAVLLAKRAVEDAQKAPAEDYDTEILGIELAEKQRKLKALYYDTWMGDEIYEQIRALESEIEILKLQIEERKSAAKAQEEERKQTLLRAQEDYNATVKKQERLVAEAKEKWEEAKEALSDFYEDANAAVLEDALVLEAEAALAEAKEQEKETKREQENLRQQAERRLEDAMDGGVTDTTAEINRIAIEEKERQLLELSAVKEKEGEIVAYMDGTVTLVSLAVGQRTVETAAFLISDTSGGMSFTAQVDSGEVRYVMAGDPVTLKAADKSCEALSVVSVEPLADGGANVTVFVPEGTLALGEHAAMELTKQSKEYSITVPVSAVHTENERHFVYIMAEEDTVLGGQYMAQRMDITIAEKNGFYAAVADSSLTAESMVIVSSDQMLSAGERVRLKEGT
ncbi:MAG: biotin/lipoyl-binding protein [Blautia sp.]|nr:biotin/lipoyl-binding protein [Blautia sp.]